jgi:SAM-dependent methyltransferase
MIDRPGRRRLLLAHADGVAIAALRRSIDAFIRRETLENSAVLDLGCGSLPYREMFAARGASYLGADIDGDPDVLIVPGRPLPLAAASCDVVVSFQVLEHVRDVPAYLAEARRVLKPRGRLFLSTHGVWPYHPHPTDFWRWTADGLRVTCEDAGFVVERFHALCGPASWMAMFPLLVGQKLLGRAAPALAPVNLLVNLLALGADALTPRNVRDANAAIFVVEGRAPE